MRAIVDRFRQELRQAQKTVQFQYKCQSTQDPAHTPFWLLCVLATVDCLLSYLFDNILQQSHNLCTYVCVDIECCRRSHCLRISQ